MLALVSWCAVSIWQPAPAHAAFVGRNHWMIFSALESNGSIHVWRQGPDGALLDLTGTSSAEPVRGNDNFSPAWSPEQGAHVAFVSAKRRRDGHGPGDVWFMIPYPSRTHGSGLVNLTSSPDADDESPAWDFTGGKLTWARAPIRDGRTLAFDIWRMSWLGLERTNLTPGTVSNDIEPAWAPRTRDIAFASNRRDGAGSEARKTYGIWLMRANDGEIVRRIVAHGRAPNWSPDGTRLVFVRGGNIWIVNRNGTGLERLTDAAPSVNDKPVFSPDGRRIAFQTGIRAGGLPQRGMALVTMKTDGTDRRPLLRNPLFIGQSEPDWKPECTARPHRVDGRLVVTGTPGPDLICFTKADQTVYAGGGADSIYGGAGDTVVHAGAGDDIVLGGPGIDAIYGTDGADYLEADSGNDRVVGGPGPDLLMGGEGNDTLWAEGRGSGHDGVSGGDGSDVCIVDSRQVDARSQCETIRLRLGLGVAAR